MPFDGTDYQPEQSLEERALRHALAFFTDESKWHRGMSAHGLNGSMCVGLAIIRGAKHYDPNSDPDYFFADGALGRENDVWVADWNSNCPSFTALKAHLKSRIEYYTKQRLSHSYLVVIGPGRQVQL